MSSTGKIFSLAMMIQNRKLVEKNGKSTQASRVYLAARVSVQVVVETRQRKDCSKQESRMDQIRNFREHRELFLCGKIRSSKTVLRG